MHFEVPKSKFASIREFFGEYSMIVVSILTALALEFAAESLHHRHRAEQARKNMDAELQANLVGIRNARKANEVEAKVLADLAQKLADDIVNKLPDAEIVARFKKNADGKFNLLLRIPEPRHDAWDTAVASQAASWIAPDVFLKYSKTYTDQRGLPAMVRGNKTTLLDGARMVDVLTDLQLGTVAPRDLMHTVAQMAAVHGIADKLLENSEKHTSKIFPELANAKS